MMLAMKRLAVFTLVLVVAGMTSSCGLPMAAVRTVSNTTKSAVSGASSLMNY